MEIRGLGDGQCACTCVDFRINGLGTCKHVEAVRLHLQARFKRLYASAGNEPSPRLDLVPDPGSDTLRWVGDPRRVPKAMPVDLSNLALMDKNGKPTRVGFRIDGDKKVRFAKTTGEAI